MATITPPKKPILNDGILKHVQFSHQERTDFLGILGYDEHPEKEQEWVIGMIEIALSIYFPQIDQISKTPGPEHMAAELKLILKPAKKLMERLSKENLTLQAMVYAKSHCIEISKPSEPIDLTVLHSTLLSLIENIEEGIKDCENYDKHDGRYVNQKDAELRGKFRNNLAEFFDLNSDFIPAPDRDSCKQDFLDLCFHKLPPPPSRRNRKTSQ